MKNYLESEAKLYIQKEILHGTYELVWSYIMDYEISFNLFSDRKNQIITWRKIAEIDIDVSEDIVERVNEIIKKKIKQKDSLHIARTLEAKCKYFITTDRKILNKTIDNSIIINPVYFGGMAGEEK
ncbi:MAG: PIN domain protein [Treponema sp.]|nr:PIN domain protein [Treponema sp.]